MKLARFLDQMLRSRAEARRLRFRHDDAFYGPMAKASCGCDLCYWLRMYIETTDMVDELARENERLRKSELELRDRYLRDLYTTEGAILWVADAQRKGLPVHEQLALLAQLADGAFA